MEQLKNSSFWKTTTIGTLYALCASLFLVLALAFGMKFFGMGEGAVIVIIQIIKGLSVIFGVLWALKKIKQKGFLLGLAIGVLFAVASFVVFSVLNGFVFSFSATVWKDLIFGAVIGGISGVIAVNLKK